jgi:hypothetical protein
MPNSSKGKSKKRSKNASSNKTTVRSRFHSNTAINTSSLISSLGNIGVDPTSFLANDANIAALSDMFRLFRMNSIKCDWQPSTGTGSIAAQIPSGFLGFVPYGATTPTSISDFETPLVSTPTIPFGNQNGAAYYTLVKENGTSLNLQNKDMAVLQGPGGGWLSTQGDGTQINYGGLFWALAAATASNAINYLFTTYFDVSFKDLLDPSLISAAMAKHHPNGFPDHWILNGDDAHALYPYRKTVVSARRIQMGLPPIASTRLLAVNDPQDTSSTSSSPASAAVSTPALSLWSGPDATFDLFISKCKLLYFESLTTGVDPFGSISPSGSGLGASNSP